MKKFLSVLLAVAMLLTLAPAASAGMLPDGGMFIAPVPVDYEGKVVILYTGNIGGDLSVYPLIKAAVDERVAEGAEVILVDAGGYLRGSASANETFGESVYALMDAVGYDVAAMGVEEFSFGDATTGMIYHGNVRKYYTQAMLQDGTEEVTYNVNRDGTETGILEAREAASFKTVASNVASESGYYSFESIVEIETESGLTIAFVGITDPEAASLVQDGWLEITESNAGSSATTLVRLTNDPAEEKVPTYDIVISAPRGGDMVVGEVVIDPETEEVITMRPITLGEEGDAEIAALANEYLEAASEPVGVNEVILNGADSMSRNRETNFGDLVTDALLWYAENYVDGLEEDVPLVAVQNGGNIDQFLYPGEITETDLLRALPFSPMGVSVVYVTGEQLLETLEAATQTFPTPAFAQVGGLKYTVKTFEDYDAGEAYGNFFKADSINRVEITEVGGEKFDLDATYGLVVDNYLANGSDGYYVLSEAIENGAVRLNNGNGVLTRNIVARYITNVLGGVVGDEYAEPQGRISMQSFSDVDPSIYYAEAIEWALENGVTTGAGDNTFAPNANITRADDITFLWRAAGSPVVNLINPFEDIENGLYYTDAVLWARGTGIANGTGDTTFEPGANITRADAITFLWRCAGSPVVNLANPFEDVESGLYYTDAVLWAAANGIANGTGDTTFEPNANITRADAITFIYRAVAE